MDPENQSGIQEIASVVFLDGHEGRDEDAELVFGFEERIVLMALRFAALAGMDPPPYPRSRYRDRV